MKRLVWLVTVACLVPAIGLADTITNTKVRDSANKGDAIAQCSLGVHHSFRNEFDAARKWFQLSADQGNALCQYFLGLMYLMGAGVKKDDDKAAALFRKAADQNEPSAQRYLGLMYRDGVGVKKSTSEAIMWLEKSAAQDCSEALSELAETYLIGTGDDVRQDTIKAYMWLKIASMSPRPHGNVKNVLDTLHGRMSPDDLAQAESLVRGWLASYKYKGLPPFKSELAGSNPVRIVNPNKFSVVAAIREGDKGKNFGIPASGNNTVFIPDGKYDIFFVYSDRLDALFQGDSFTLLNNGVEIQIVRVVGGNYSIRQVK